MNTFVIIALIIVVITAGISWYYSYRAEKDTEKLVDVLVQGRFEEFDRLASDADQTGKIPGFNLDLMKLNSYIMRNDDNNIRNSFDHFKQVHLNAAQKEEIGTKGFIYYLGKNDRENTGFFLEMLKNSNTSETVKQTSQMYYDIIYSGKTDYLQKLLDEVKVLPDSEKVADEKLIAIIYRNMKRDDLAEEYEKLSEKHSKKG